MIAPRRNPWSVVPDGATAYMWKNRSGNSFGHRLSHDPRITVALALAVAFGLGVNFTLWLIVIAMS